jgi:hypothetical protein
MKLFNLKKYCLILLGVEKKSIEDILRISESIPNVMAYNSTDIIVTTFSSNLNINEIKEYVKSFDVNFFAFDLNDKCAHNIVDKKTNKELFGFINDSKKVKKSVIDLKISKTEMFEDIKSHNFLHNDLIVNELDENEIESEINKILDKGYKNITKNDKSLMKNLTKK